jgi:hypothetical protein
MNSSSKKYLLDFEEEEFDGYLLALHTHLDDYQIAFHLNKYSPTKFKRIEDIVLNKDESSFSLFEWEDPLLDQKTSLFSNKYLHETNLEKTNNNALFDLPLRNEVSLFPEFKQADFFIKSNHRETIQILFKLLNSGRAVSLVYEVPSKKIKNRLNLIFDS